MNPLGERSVRVFRDALAQMGTVADAFASQGRRGWQRTSSMDPDLRHCDDASSGGRGVGPGPAHSMNTACGASTPKRVGSSPVPVTLATLSRGELGFVTMLSGILFGIGFDEWDDRTIASFRDRLESAVHRVEDAALERADGSPAFEPFLKNRLATAFDRYSSSLGRERLMQYLDEIYRERR